MSQRAQAVFAALLVVALAVLIYRAAREPEEEASRSDRRRGRGAARAEVLAAAEVPVLSYLHRPPVAGAANERDRDLFAYAESPAEREAREAAEREAREAAERAAEERRKMEEARRKALEEQRAREAAEALARARQAAIDAETAAPPPPPPAKPPEFPYRYVGLIGPRDDAYAILEDDEQNFLYAKAGDVLDSAFLVHHVGPFTLHLGFTDERFVEEVAHVPRTFKTAPSGGAGAPRPPARPGSRS
jgi:hypothetical protein